MPTAVLKSFPPSLPYGSLKKLLWLAHGKKGENKTDQLALQHCCFLWFCVHISSLPFLSLCFLPPLGLSAVVPLLCSRLCPLRYPIFRNVFALEIWKQVSTWTQIRTELENIQKDIRWAGINLCALTWAGTGLEASWACLLEMFLSSQPSPWFFLKLGCDYTVW